MIRPHSFLSLLFGTKEEERAKPGWKLVRDEDAEVVASFRAAVMTGNLNMTVHSQPHDTAALLDEIRAMRHVASSIDAVREAYSSLVGEFTRLREGGCFADLEASVS